MARVYAPFAATAIGPDLALERGDTIVLCAEDGRDGHRLARSQFGQTEGGHDVEILFFAPSGGDGEVGKSNLFAGVVDADHPLDAYVGEHAGGYGLRLDTGSVMSAGEVIADTRPIALGEMIRIRLDLGTRTAPVCHFYASETLLASIELPAGKTWHYAVTVSGGGAESIRCYANAGQQAFTAASSSDRTETGITGWWQETPQLAEMLWASDEYLSLATDAEPAVRFRRVLADAAIENTSAIAFWPDTADRGEVTASGSVGAIDVVDADRSYIPSLMSTDIRDQRVEIFAVEEGGSLNNAEAVAIGLVETIAQTSDREARITVRDASVELDVPLQPRLVLPNADAAAVDKPWPCLIGAARSASMILIDADAGLWAVSHRPLTGIASVRCKGRVLDPHAIVPDYTLSSDGMSINVRPGLEGKLTMDLSAQGQFTSGAPGVDLLAGAGQFSSMTSTVELASKWNRGGTSPSHFPRWADYGNYLGRCEFIGSSNSTPAQSWLVSPTPIIKAHRVYRVRAHIEFIAGYSDFGGMSWMFLGGRPHASYWAASEWARWENTTVSSMSGEYPDSGISERVFRNPEAVDLPLGLQLTTAGGVTWNGRVRWLELYELPAVTDVPDLAGVSLAEYTTQVLSLARCRPDLCDIKSAREIDHATGYLYGTQVLEPATAADVLGLALRSCCATVVPRRSGGFAITRFVVPEDVPDAEMGIEITESMFISEPTRVLDQAPGLTNRLSGGRNIERYSDSDFSDDFDPGTGVPQSMRRLLVSEYRWTVTSGIQLAGCYRHALSAKPLGSVFDRPADGRAALDFVLRGYRVPRYLGQITIARPRGVRFEAGAVHRVTYSEWDFQRRPVHVRAVSSPDVATALLTIWSS